MAVVSRDHVGTATTVQCLMVIVVGSRDHVGAETTVQCLMVIVIIAGFKAVLSCFKMCFGDVVKSF
jgi:hypothetical protein